MHTYFLTLFKCKNKYCLYILPIFQLKNEPYFFYFIYYP